MDKTKYIKIASEYGCEPIWISEDGRLYYYDDDRFVLSDPEISEPLLKWDSIFQNTFDSSYPPDSRFENAQQLHDYELKGIDTSSSSTSCPPKSCKATKRATSACSMM